MYGFGAVRYGPKLKLFLFLHTILFPLVLLFDLVKCFIYTILGLLNYEVP